MHAGVLITMGSQLCVVLPDDWTAHQHGQKLELQQSCCRTQLKEAIKVDLRHRYTHIFRFGLIYTSRGYHYIQRVVPLIKCLINPLGN